MAKTIIAAILLAFLLSGCEYTIKVPPAKFKFEPLIRDDCGRPPGCYAFVDSADLG